MKRIKPVDMLNKPVFESKTPERDLLIYEARRIGGWRIEVIALAARLTSMRIRQIIAEGDRLLNELRNRYGADEVVTYPFEKV